MNIQAVIFDIGGVLEITPDTGVQERWERELGLGPGRFAQLTESIWSAGEIGEISEEDVHTQLRRRLGLDPGQVNRLMQEVWTEYLGTPNDELIDYFRSLRPRVKTALLSNSFVGAREKEQERYGFEDITDVIVYSHEVGLRKPDPAIYALTCSQLKVRPQSTIFLDDSQFAVDGAIAQGMQGVLFEDNEQARSSISSLMA